MGHAHFDLAQVPDDATLVLDGEVVSRDRLKNEVALTVGPHVLTVAAPGFAAYRREVPVASGRTTSVTVALAPTDTAKTSALVSALVSSASVPRPDRPPAAPPAGDRVGTLMRIPTAPPRPPLTPVVYESVPDRPSITDQPLDALLASPGDYGNRWFEPIGLFVMGRRGVRNPDGTVTTHVAKVGLHVRNASLSVLAQADNPRQVVLDHGFALQLDHLHALAITYGETSLTGNFAQDFNDSAAVLSFAVARRREGTKEEWVPLLRKAEYLLGMNYSRIGYKKYKDSFATLTLVPEGIVRRGVSPRTDWSERIGARYRLQVENFVRGVKNAQFNQEMQQLSGAMNRALGDIMRNTPDPARALDSQLRNRFGR
jgi:hypothetical protein